MLYFIADTHFGHENILKLCNRPFETAEQMNETLIENWNKKVGGTDTVYILGDMFYRYHEPESILKRLNGQKYLVVGNHDGSWMGDVDCGKYFKDISLMLEVNDGRHALTLCHYPLVTWKRERGSYMIHGHIHAKTDLDFWHVIRSRGNLLNAGVDINGFQPVTFEELLLNNKVFKEGHPE